MRSIPLPLPGMYARPEPPLLLRGAAQVAGGGAVSERGALGQHERYIDALLNLILVCERAVNMLRREAAKLERVTK